MSFFDSNNYFIDQKVNFLKFGNTYKVFNGNGEEIGAVTQKISGGQKVLRVLLNKSMLPFNLEIRDSNNELQASIKRGWTFFMSKITIEDSKGITVGSIKQKFSLKPTFKIYSSAGQLVATIKGDWRAWDFTIKDASEQKIGTITKKWAGAMKELFTSADKYNVNIEPNYSNDASKIAIISSAITIDMVLKESKN